MSDEKPKKISSYADLLVWQKAMDLVVVTYGIAKRLPASETYGLISQMQRAAVSVPANIAEGHGRRHTGDFIHHLTMANGSLKELETHLLIAVRLGYLQAQEIEGAMNLAGEVGRMLSALIGKLRAR